MNKIFSRLPVLRDVVLASTMLRFDASTTKKNLCIETLRGMAIILVVLGHMIGYSEAGGMRVANDSIFRYLYFSLEYIRLPLFTVISGWVYANKPVIPGKESQFLKGKFRRLIIPMLVLSTALFVLRIIIPGTNTTPDIRDLPRNLVLPYDVYWYLFSLFLIFSVIVILDTKAFFHSLPGWCTTVLAALGCLFFSENFLDPVPNLFSFKGAAYLFPFFLLGVGIHRFRFPSDTRVIVPAFLIFIFAVTFQQMSWFGYVPIQERHSLLGLSVGISAALLLFRLELKSNFLVFIGHHAYGIFLFHVFFTGGSRIVLSALGMESQWGILLLGTCCAVVISIIVENIVRQSPMLRLFVLGLRQKGQ